MRYYILTAQRIPLPSQTSLYASILRCSFKTSQFSSRNIYKSSFCWDATRHKQSRTPHTMVMSFQNETFVCCHNICYMYKVRHICFREAYNIMCRHSTRLPGVKRRLTFQGNCEQRRLFFLLNSCVTCEFADRLIFYVSIWGKG